MSLTLLVLAAGMGSRYGGLKQMDPMGPCGEFVLDYSVYDALRSGFDRAVFVIRHEMEADFREIVLSRFGKRMETKLVMQDSGDLPPGWMPPPERSKPWGTGHAVWAARAAVKQPFVAINADDFYGRDAFRRLADFLRRVESTGSHFAMAGYRLDHTLSEHGTVARGVCEVSDAGLLESVTERTGIRSTNAGIFDESGAAPVALGGDATVSLNFWGLTPAVFPLLEAGMVRFLKASAGDPKAEFYLPAAISDAVGADKADVRVLETDGRWFGVTYPSDKQTVTGAIRKLIADGEYPERLWK